MSPPKSEFDPVRALARAIVRKTKRLKRRPDAKTAQTEICRLEVIATRVCELERLGDRILHTVICGKQPDVRDALDIPDFLRRY